MPPLPRRRLLSGGLALAGATGMAWTPGPARAQDHPPARPTRDVDVTYTVPTPAGAARQRLRYSALVQKLRLDPPGGGIYVVIDFLSGRMFTVRPAERSIIEMAAPTSWMPGMGHARYTRRNATTVAGVPCTEWQTTDSEGRDVLICLDADGVMLRAGINTRDGEATLALATELRRETQDAAIFRVPAEYRHLTPPPVRGAQ